MKDATKPASIIKHRDGRWRSAFLVPAALLALLVIAVLWQSYNMP